MHWSSKSDYGLQVLKVLVRQWAIRPDDYLHVNELAVELGISRKYVEHLLLPLAWGELIETKRGQHGGCRLRRPPNRVSLAEAFEALEGRSLPGLSEISQQTGYAPQLTKVIERISDTTRHILEAETLEVLADPV